MNKIKIALACPASLPATQFGGILFLAVDIARELSEIGNEVVIYTTDLDFANNPSTFNKNLPKCEPVEKFKIKRTHVWFSFGLFFINPSMYKQILMDKPDIIHSIGVRSFQSFIVALISKYKKIPLVLSDQGGLTTHPDLQNSSFIKKIFYKIQKPMIKFIVNQSSEIIVANKYEEKIFREFSKGKKITIIRNGINLKDFQKNEINFKEKYSIDFPFILFVGRFSKVKGVDTLIKSFNLIKNYDKVKNLKLIIMGVDFGFQEKMLKMIKEYELEEKIIVIKNPPRKDVIAAYSESEFLVLPSRWELSPLTPLEGFAFKKPVISTNAHGIPFTISNNENGILVEPDNPKELSDAILELIKDKNKKNELGIAGFKLVKDTCNSKNMAKNTLNVYNNLITKINKTTKL